MSGAWRAASIQDQVQQNERVRIPRTRAETHVRQTVDDRCRHRDDHKHPGAAEAGDSIGEPVAEGSLRFDDRVWIARGAAPDECLGGVQPPPEHGHHVERGMRLLLHQREDVVAIDLDAQAFLECHGRRLVPLLIEQRRESEEVAARRFVEEHVPLVLVDGRYSTRTVPEHVRPPGGVTDLVDALSRSKRPEFNLRRQDRELVIVEQREERHLSEIVVSQGIRHVTTLRPYA